MPTRVLAFVSLIVVSAIAALVGLVVREPSVDGALIVGSASFAVLGVGTYLVAYRFHGSTSGTVSFIPFLASILLYPSWPTVALISVGVLVSELLSKKRQPIKRLFNFAQHVLAASCAVYAFTSLGGVSLQQRPDAHVLAEIGSVLAFLGTNTLAVAAVVSISERRNIWQVWISNVQGSITPDLVAIPFIHASAVVFTHFQFWGLSFLALLLFAARRYYHTNIQLKKFNQELLEVLVHTVEMRDPYTSGHSQRVARYSKIIARAIGVSPKQVDRIAVAALLHDVGKIHEIFARILSKPGRLTQEERAIMELHPIKSAELVDKVSELADVLPAVRHHHENWDGTGYPSRLAGRDIPLGSRIIMFADTIDAMTTDRPYRKALGEAEVRAELSKFSGKQFDPYICETLLKSPDFAAIFTGEDARGTRSITQVFDLARRERTVAVA
jgi:putative nucleotidyltransferase with HDIG domain